MDNEEDPVVQNYLTKNIKTNILNSSDKLLGFLEHVLNIDVCRNIDNLYFERLVDKSFDYFNFINKGVSILRLDAVGFLWKKSNTECLNLPETHLIIKLIRSIID